MKKQAKRWLAMLLSLTMVLSLLPTTALTAFAAGTITPDGAVTDTWTQVADTKVTGSVDPAVQNGKLLLQAVAANENNCDSATPPAFFENAALNAALAAADGEKEVSFKVKLTATGERQCFGFAVNFLNRKENAFIGYNSMGGWFLQHYYSGSQTWPNFTGPDLNDGREHSIKVKWTDTQFTLLEVDGTECTLPDAKDFTAVTTHATIADANATIGVVDKFAIKCGKDVSTGSITTAEICDLHYTGQATISTYDVSGKVTAEGGAALAGATVSAGGAYTTTTAANGSYTLALPNGTYTLTVSKDGYANGTKTVTVSNADMPNQDVQLEVAHTVEIPKDGVDNGDWAQIEATKVSGSTVPTVTGGKLVLKSGNTNGRKIKDVTPTAAMFMSSKLNTELAASTDTTKTLSFTLVPETEFSSSDDRLPGYLAFGVVIDSNESNQGYMIHYSNEEGWLLQNYGGTGGYTVIRDLAAPTAGRPIDFEITWTRSALTLKINGQTVEQNVTMEGLTKTDKIAFFAGGSHYDNDNHSLQTERRTKLTISNLHYSGQEKVTAYKVAGTVKDDSNHPLAGVTVSADNGRFTAATDATGAYSMNLPEGTYTIKAELDGYSSAEKDNFAVNSGVGHETLEATDFTLDLLPTISGKVVDKDGRGVIATVQSDKREAEGKLPTVSAADGTFTIIGAVDGEHTITASAEGYETKTVKATVDGANVSDVNITLAEREIPSYELTTSDMTVKVARGFPQVINYTMKDGTVMYGQTAELDTILINGAVASKTAAGTAVVPTVTSVLDEQNNKVVYTMVIDESNNNGTGVNATITAEIRAGLAAGELNNKDSAAAGRTLGFYITGVEYAGADAAEKAANRLAHPLQTIEIPNHSLVSVRSTQTGANVSGAKLASSTIASGDKHYTADGAENLQFAIDGYKEDFFSAFVYNDKLSAGLASNSAYGTGSAGSGTYPVRVQFEDKNGGTTTSIGLGSTLWYWDYDISHSEAGDDQKLTNAQLTAEQRIIEPLDMPYAKVVITGDMNGNGKVDWQDGAIAYRETVMHIPAGSEVVPDSVNLRISMNFGSMATNPFLIALDNVKRVAAHTDGLGQFVLLKGYAGEGHDSNHPQYDNIGIRMGGPEDLKTLMTEGGKLGANFGIHVNASEFYAEAIQAENQVRRNTDGSIHYGWNWLDQGIAINAVYDFASGLRQDRWDALYEIVKGHPFLVYVDVWGNYTSGTEDDFMTRALSNEIVGHEGWRIAHEWSYGNPYESTLQHWVSDYTYGDYNDKGKLNSNIMRFLLNQYKDSFTPDFASFGGAANAPLLGGPAMQGFEGWQGDGEYDLSIYNTFNQMIYTKFLQHYSVTEWTNASANVAMPWAKDAGGPHDGETRHNEKNVQTSGTVQWTPEVQIKLSDGKDTIVVTRGTTGQLKTDFGLTTVPEFLAGETEYRSRVVTLNGKTIVTGAPASAGEDNTFPASKATLKYLIPWYWDNNGDRVTADNEKLYHWNAEGGTSTWDLPNGWTNLANVMVYELSDQGRGTGKSVQVSNGRITLTDIKKNTGYVVTKGAEKAAAPAIEYGDGLHLEDPSFNIDTPKGPWTIAGNGSAVRTTNSEGISVLKMIGEVSVSQELTGLTAGKNYVMYAAVDNRSNAKATMTITDNTGKVVATNYTGRSIARNYISSYYLHNGHGMEAGSSYFQNMFLYFTPEAGKQYTLTLSRENGNGSVYFDDIRTVEYGFNYSGFGAGQTAQAEKGSAAFPVEYIKDENGNATGAISSLHQDFENVPQGIWPFVVGPAENVADNRVHVSELNKPFTQAGWDVKKMDDVIAGNWSIKINGLSGRSNLIYQTIPQNFRFEPGSVYTVEFDYELGSAGSYVAVVGDGAYTSLDNLTAVYNLDKTLEISVPATPNVDKGGVNKANVGHAKFTVVGAVSGQTWIGIYSRDNADNQGASGSAADFGGYKDFVLDNLSIELAPADKNALAQKLQEADPMVEEVYNEGTPGDWTAFVTARTNAHTVFDNDEATTEQINAVLDALTEAMGKLTKVTFSISGTVKNANDTPVEGAVLTLENGETRSHRGEVNGRETDIVDEAGYRPVGLTVTTGADGTFTFVSKNGVELLPDTYYIKAEATGYYVTTTAAIEVTKENSVKNQNIVLEAEAPGAYVNDFNNGDISMMGYLVPEDSENLPTIEATEYDANGALKITWNAGGSDETRHLNNVVDKTVTMANGTFSFDVVPLTNDGLRLGITFRGQEGTTGNVDRVFVGQEDMPTKWFVEYWNSEGDPTTGYNAVTPKDIGLNCNVKRNVRAVMDGKRFQVYVDGLKIYDVDASSSLSGLPTAAGYVGFNMRLNAGSEYIIDNIRIIRADAADGVYNVSGTVNARSGADVSGAAVELYKDGVRVAGTTTNALGQYQVSRVEPGTYTVKVSAPFFQGKEESITVVDANLTDQDFTLVPDISSLTALIAEVEALNETDYTEETWNPLATALTAARAIDGGSSIAALNTAYRDLSNARNNLVEKERTVDYSALRALYNEKALVEDDGYTATTWAAFQQALNTALGILSDGSATQTMIDNARDGLQAAYSGLKKAPSGGDNPSGPSGGGIIVPPATTTTTTTNPDGTTTTTVTDNRTGTVTETTEKLDGGKEIVEIKKDGTITNTAVDPDGGKVEKVTDPEKNVAITVTDPEGEVMAEVEIPAVIPEPEVKFVDVPDGHWAEKAIYQAAGLKLVEGVGNDMFELNGNMKRGDLAHILRRMSNGGENYELKFEDVPADKYYAGSVAWAAQTKVVTGMSETEFAPESSITRQELAVMLYRYANLLNLDTTEAPADALDAFVDGGSTSDWAVDGMAWCVKAGILEGKGEGILDPTSNVTRAETAIMFQRLMLLMK